MNEASLNTCGRCGAPPLIPHDPGCHAPCVLRDNRYRAMIRDLVGHLENVMGDVGCGLAARAAEDFLTRNNLLERTS